MALGSLSCNYVQIALLLSMLITEGDVITSLFTLLFYLHYGVYDGTSQVLGEMYIHIYKGGPSLAPKKSDPSWMSAGLEYVALF